MSLIHKLEPRFGRFAVQHLTLGRILLQVAVFVVGQGEIVKAAADKAERQTIIDRIALVPDKVLEGEAWRLLTFICEPPCMSIVWAFFYWYLFYLVGEALEHIWGAFRYNVYLLIGYLATVAVSFLTPQAPASIAFLQGSVFLAFATFVPNFEILIFFVFPVKVKWLALLAWIGYFFALIGGEWTTRLMVLASISNYLLFFNKEIVERIRAGRRRMEMQAKSIGARVGDRQKPYFHRCTVCGITDRSHPKAVFRYCTDCDGGHGYCMEHLKNHEHIKKGETLA